MWTVLVSSSALPPLAALSRVFLGPIVPGWVDERGHVHLPLRMEPSEVSLEISHEDKTALQAWHQENAVYFASRYPGIGLLGSKEEFQNELRPNWLKNAAVRIRTTIEAYASAIPPTSSLSPIAQVLEARSASLHHLLSSCLYMGQEFASEDQFCLIPQDLTLYGDALKPEGNLYGLLRLIETVAHVDILIASGMTDVVTVAQGDRMRRLHDALAGRARHPELRPECFYEADDEGHIDPLQSNEAMVHDDYDAFQSALVHENKLLLGCYLFAELGLGEDDLACLIDERTSAIVLQNLGASHLIRGPEAQVMARFLAIAARETNAAPKRD